jgi:hypothetical protein
MHTQRIPLDETILLNMTLKQCIVSLFMKLPVHDYLSSQEIRKKFVNQLHVTHLLSANEVQAAFRSVARKGLIVTTTHTLAKMRLSPVFGSAERLDHSHSPVVQNFSDDKPCGRNLQNQ